MKKVALILTLALTASALLPAEPWFRSQIGTGDGNCGPASVAMVIEWATGKKFTVQQIRKEMGRPWADGSTSIEMLMANLKRHGVHARIVTQKSLDQLADLVDGRNALAIICVHTEAIEPAKKGSQFGRKYNIPDTLHFVVLNGTFAEYFRVEDPLGSPDRLYKMNQVYAGMGKDSAEFILVYR